MDYYLFTARSITHAQQMAQTLERVGVYLKMRRIGSAVTGRGCGYTLQVPKRQFQRAAAALREAGQKPVKVFLVSGGMRKEVSL